MKSIIEKIFKPLEIYALSLAFLFTNLFDKNLTIENVDDTPVRGLLLNLRSLLDIFLDTEGFIGSYVLVIQFIIIVWIILGQKARIATDIFAIYLTICWFLELICMNLLLVSPILNPVFMLVELVLFIPIILIGFSWWYWRLNHQSRIGKGDPSITFDKPPTYLSYFIKTACVAVNDTTEHGVCQSDAAKLVRIFNGFVVMDVFGLTLSRAVGLVIS